MDALFQDVQEMRGKLNRKSRIWVDQIEARSVIDDYVTNLEDTSFLTALSRHQSQHLISNKIDDVRNKIEDASRRRKAYGLVQIQSSDVSSSSSTVHGNNYGLRISKLSSASIIKTLGAGAIRGMDCRTRSTPLPQTIGNQIVSSPTNAS
jgi:hypothetical protein